MVEYIFYITVIITIVAVVFSIIYWLQERKDRF